MVENAWAENRIEARLKAHQTPCLYAQFMTLIQDRPR